MRFLFKQSSEALSDIAVAVLEKWGDALQEEDEAKSNQWQRIQNRAMRRSSSNAGPARLSFHTVHF